MLNDRMSTTSHILASPLTVPVQPLWTLELKHSDVGQRPKRDQDCPKLSR